MYNLQETIITAITAIMIGIFIGAMATYASADTNAYNKAMETNSSNWNNANQCITLLEEIKEYSSYTNDLLRVAGLVQEK